MASFFVHQGSSSRSTRLVVEPTWALAVRAMVGRHDAGGSLAQGLVESFADLMRSYLESAETGRPSGVYDQRERIATVVHAAVAAAGAQGDDGVFFTVFVATEHGVRVFGLGPQRTFLARAGENDTVLFPQSLAHQVRRAGISDPLPEHALVSMRIANRNASGGDIDATEVQVPVDAWLVAQLDDRAPPLSLPALPRTPEEMVAALRDNARDVPNLADDWLLASGRPLV